MQQFPFWTARGNHHFLAKDSLYYYSMDLINPSELLRQAKPPCHPREVIWTDVWRTITPTPHPKHIKTRQASMTVEQILKATSLRPSCLFLPFFGFYGGKLLSEQLWKNTNQFFGDESIVEHVVAYVPPLRSSHHQDCFVFSSNISKKTFTMIELKHFNHVLDDGRCSFQWLKDFLLNHLWFPNSVGSKQEFSFITRHCHKTLLKWHFVFALNLSDRGLGILWFTFAGISDERDFCCEYWPRSWQNQCKDHWM